MKSMRLLTTWSGKQVAVDPATVTMLLETDKGLEVYMSSGPSGMVVKGTIRDVASRLDITLIER